MDQEEARSWAERNGFADWALALLWIIGAFVLFQVAAGIVVAVLIIASKEGKINAAEFGDLLTQNLDLMFIGNSTGQIVFLGLATFLVAGLHTSRERRSAFLRFQVHDDTLRMMGWTAILILAAQPAIWFLSWLNAMIPVPETFTQLQNSQMEMIENYLKGDHLLLVTLFHVALVPAVCEEVLYRGYVLRTFEKSWGIVLAIIFSGLFFGLYHIQLSNLLPLASIGMLLAFIAWTSKSIYPAMLAHFINNGSSVLLGTYYPESAFSEITPETMPPVWAVISSLLISAYIVYLMYNQYTTKPAE